MSQDLGNDVRTRSRTQAERAALSDRLMTEAAIRLLVSQGVGGTTLKAIGDESGYSRGLATHRFGSKAGLFRHVLRDVSAEWVARIDEAVGDRIGADALTAVVDVQFHFIKDSPEKLRAMYILWMASGDPASEFKTKVADVHRAQRADVKRWVELGQEADMVRADLCAERVAEQFVALLLGITFQWLVNPKMPLYEMHQALKRQIRFLLAPAEGNDTAAT